MTAVVWLQAREEMDRLQGQRRSEVVTRIRDSGAALDEVTTRTLDELSQSRPGSAAPRGGQVCLARSSSSRSSCRHLPTDLLESRL